METFSTRTHRTIQLLKNCSLNYKKGLQLNWLERQLCKLDVKGSSPFSSTNLFTGKWSNKGFKLQLCNIEVARTCPTESRRAGTLRAHSSAGQSASLIRTRSLVQIQMRPPSHDICYGMTVSLLILKAKCLEIWIPKIRCSLKIKEKNRVNELTFIYATLLRLKLFW